MNEATADRAEKWLVEGGAGAGPNDSDRELPQHTHASPRGQHGSGVALTSPRGTLQGMRGPASGHRKKLRSAPAAEVTRKLVRRAPNSRSYIFFSVRLLTCLASTRGTQHPRRMLPLPLLVSDLEPPPLPPSSSQIVYSKMPCIPNHALAIVRACGVSCEIWGRC
jgi:hypothetical protein